jgi:hypothetical protein
VLLFRAKDAIADCRVLVPVVASDGSTEPIKHQQPIFDNSINVLLRCWR